MSKYLVNVLGSIAWMSSIKKIVQIWREKCVHLVRVGAAAITLVDKGDSRYVIATHLAVYRHRLRLHATNSCNGTVSAQNILVAALHMWI